MQPWGRVRGVGTAFLTMVAALGTRMPRWSLIPPPYTTRVWTRAGGTPSGKWRLPLPAEAAGAEGLHP